MNRDLPEQFNAAGRSCPVCLRVGTLTGDFINGATLECTGGMGPGRSADLTKGGCCARFTFTAPDTLTRIRTPDVRPLTLDEMERVRGGVA